MKKNRLGNQVFEREAYCNPRFGYAANIVDAMDMGRWMDHH
jgi:hypothetical protein